MVTQRSLTYPTRVTGRVTRRPRVDFQLKTLPWQLQPFCILPVLPGETMKNALWQSRVISDPLKNRLLGAHKEYWLFYVRLRDLQGSTEFEEMMLDPNKDMSSYRSAASVRYFHKYGINWTKMCLDKIVEHYFRAEGEGSFTIDGMPARSVGNDNWTDSLMNDADFAPIEDVDVDANADNTITVGEIDKAQRNFALMRQFGLTEMDFDDYLRTFGIRVAPAESDKPELLRYESDWQYPTNTVDPTTGTPTTAWAMSPSGRADKDRFFKEPGFVIGITCTKPKVYMSRQGGSVTGLLDSALRWLPAMMRDDPYTSMINVETASKNNGPLDNPTDGYWFDMRDLFLYGEHFANFTIDGNSGGVALPALNGQKRYPDVAMAKSLFRNAGKETIYEEGVASFTILGSQRDASPAPRPMGI